ncbi:AAA family ATPase [Sphaerotilus sulfidivorans]|uniref:AAA family ATPase n=2 Tax=Sphaerotilus sulfidivorans TaxID=639200 RepID=A0A5C1PXE6_9BURK|nr:AAA family ATPase [Sphaerotilus sulfidivorans]QEN00473.1 AAA family ATPase [Sphaerotilus sulfidivorans]
MVLMMTSPHHMQLTQPAVLSRLLERLLGQIGSVVVGKPVQILDSVACLLAGGHLLIEDVPGVGKTTLAHALAAALGLRFARVQFTADLTPSDLIGVSVYERNRESFVFHQGPVFTQVLLADEINRAGPRTQSALLEAMEEHQVSVDGETLRLPAPFFVIATQNPAEQIGTHALPESQLDRFLMCLTLGYPDPASERALLEGHDRRAAVRELAAVMGAAELQAAQAAVQQVHAAPALLDYLQALIAATRDGRWFVQGLSPRAALGLLRAARARALLARRDHVIPEDLQALAVPVLAHRLQPRPGAGRSRAAQVQAMIEAVGLV